MIEAAGEGILMLLVDGSAVCLQLQKGPEDAALHGEVPQPKQAIPSLYEDTGELFANSRCDSGPSTLFFVKEQQQACIRATTVIQKQPEVDQVALARFTIQQDRLLQFGEILRRFFIAEGLLDPAKLDKHHLTKYFHFWIWFHSYWNRYVLKCLFYLGDSVAEMTAIANSLTFRVGDEIGTYVKTEIGREPTPHELSQALRIFRHCCRYCLAKGSSHALCLKSKCRPALLPGGSGSGSAMTAWNKARTASTNDLIAKAKALDPTKKFSTAERKAMDEAYEKVHAKPAAAPAPVGVASRVYTLEELLSRQDLVPLNLAIELRLYGYA
jgi:hypothetical protein